MFGANLKKLSQSHPSISEVSRQLGINRTQLNRYLSGESFPRPDVLARICDFFKVDARILLEPVENVVSNSSGLAGPALKTFLGPGVSTPPESILPTGFYRFSRRSFLHQSEFVLGTVRLWREDDGGCVVRGFEARDAMKRQGLPPTLELREFRGLVLSVENGIAMMISRRKALTCSFNFISRVPSFENNFWVGYASRTVPEMPGGHRATRMVYEYLGDTVAAALPAARQSGFIEEINLPGFHRQLLEPGKPFA